MKPCKCRVIERLAYSPVHYSVEYCPLHKAAPELLEALRGLLDGLDANLDERCGLSDEEWEQRIKDANAAIAKVKRG